MSAGRHKPHHAPGPLRLVQARMRDPPPTHAAPAIAHPRWHPPFLQAFLKQSEPSGRANILAINSHQPHAFSKSQLTQTPIDAATQAPEGKGHAVKRGSVLDCAYAPCPP